MIETEALDSSTPRNRKMAPLREEQLSKEIEWAKSELVDLKFSSPTVVHVEKGFQADAVILAARDEADDARRVSKFVLKRFWEDQVRTGIRGVTEEFRALQDLHEAFNEKPCGLTCPRPITLSPSGLAYLMTFVNGRRLDQFSPRDRATRSRISNGVLKGLAIYYEKVGGLYADFQPRNILFDDDSIAFIDPTLAAEVHARISRQLTHQPASADIGYWLFSIAAQMTKSLAFQPIRAFRLLRLTEELVSQASGIVGPGTSDDSFLDDVDKAAHLRLDLMRRRRGIKGAPLRLVGELVVRRVIRRARLRNVADKRSLERLE